MPPLPGEDRLVTLFADIHYYFGTPTVRPLLHRFDKASYFYIYHNHARHTNRIEVANNPGTAEQDAFNGYLESCRVINSHRFPTLLTLVVDGASSDASSPSTRSGRDPEEWRLPSADPRDPGKQKYRIHTLDIYFWAEEDAKLVIDTCKRLLSPSQLDITELEPELAQEKQQDVVNPVVQNLENVAISDPAYQNGQTRNSQSQAQQQPSQQTHAQQQPSQQTHAQQQPSQQTHAQPPSQAAASMSPASAISSVGSKTTQPDTPQAFIPMVYNPAAPPAPEPIAHREDTPPPPDDGTGTGLTAATHDAGYGGTQSQPWTNAPPANPYNPHSSPPPNLFASSPPPPSFGAPISAVTSAQDPRHPSIAAQHYVPSPSPPSQAYSPDPVETPGAQFYPSSSPQPHKPLQHVQPQYADYLAAGGKQASPPPGGYGQFNYAQSQQQQAPQGGGYDVHSQLYRPTEQEASAHGRNKHRHRPSKTDGAGAGAGEGQGDEAGGRESRVDKVEKGVGKFWKRVDKKFGIS